MDEMNQKVKMKVLQELMDLMDEKQLGSLKSKSPKFAKVDIQSNDPSLAERIKDKMMSTSDSEDQNEDPAKEMTPEDFKEDLSEGEDPLHETDHSDMQDDDLEKLKELYARLK